MNFFNLLFKNKIVGFIITTLFVLLVTTILFIGVLYVQKSISFNNVTVKIRDEVIKDVTVQQDNQQKSTVVTEQSNKEVTQATVKNEVKNNEIKKDIIEKIKTIEEKYGSSETLTDVDKAKKEWELRLVRVNSLWVSFCNKYPQDTDCLAN